jgi:acyl-CoA thioester hydrolase
MIFEQKRIVKSSHIDDLNHVNNVVYIQWMDEVAFAHWSELTKENPLPQYIWVVLRHEIDYLKQALLGDEITIKTWVGATHGFKSERHMEFFKNNQLLVKAKTVWGMLNADTYKPVRIRENVLKVLEPSK